MKVLIVEDESLAAEKLQSMLKETDPSIQVLAHTGSITETVRWLMHHTADLIFLDIQLSDGLSFSVFEQISVNTPVIFTTAYDQYAIKAFQLNSIAYLLKPIRQTDLAESLKKYQSLKAAYSIDFESLMATIQGKDPGFKKRFLIQIGDKIRKVEVADVAYFFALEKGVYLRTKQGHTYPLEYTLDKLEGILDPSVFFRINRKYIVQMDSIKSMLAWSRSRVKLELTPTADDDMETIVSIDRAAAFKNWLND